MVNAVDIQRFENELELVPIEDFTRAENRRCFILFGASELTEREKTDFIEKECAKFIEASDAESHNFFIAERMVTFYPDGDIIRTLWPK